LLISINSDSNGTEFVAFPEDQQKKAVKTYIEFAAKNPSRFLRQRAISLWELWGPKSLAGYRQEQETAVVKGIVVLRTLFLLVFLVGVVLFRKQPEVHFAAIPIAVVTIIHMLTFSNHRFLVPIEPFLFTISLAGGGVCLKKVVDLSKRGRLSTSKSVGAH
jgi:hypothetical protein